MGSSSAVRGSSQHHPGGSHGYLTWGRVSEHESTEGPNRYEHDDHPAERVTPEREAELLRLVARIRTELIDVEAIASGRGVMEGSYRTLLHQLLDNIEETQDRDAQGVTPDN